MAHKGNKLYPGQIYGLYPQQGLDDRSVCLSVGRIVRHQRTVRVVINKEDRESVGIPHPRHKVATLY